MVTSKQYSILLCLIMASVFLLIPQADAQQQTGQVVFERTITVVDPEDQTTISNHDISPRSSDPIEVEDFPIDELPGEQEVYQTQQIKQEAVQVVQEPANQQQMMIQDLESEEPSGKGQSAEAELVQVEEELTELQSEAELIESDAEEEANAMKALLEGVEEEPLGMPNLTPFKPSGWSGAIVVSNVTGTTTASSPIYSDQDIYIDWAVLNNGTSSANSRYYTYLYVDNVKICGWYGDPPLQPQYYTYVKDKNIGKLSIGTHTIKLVADATGAIPESSESDNQASVSITVSGRGSPNLTIFKPSGWSDSIVVSNVSGTTTSADTIYSDQDVYVDWAAINNGSSDIQTTFYSKLYVDNIERGSWYASSLSRNYYTYVKDKHIGKLGAGSHTFKVCADTSNAVSESNEGDNCYSFSKTIASRGAPNLTPYKPSGWDSQIVVSNVTGTRQNASQIYSNQDVFVDWAVINNGNASTNAVFYVKLYVDNVEKGSWYHNPPLQSWYYTSVDDKNIGKLAAGTHTFKIVADTTSAIAESNENDNEYSTSKAVSAPVTPDCTAGNTLLKCVNAVCDSDDNQTKLVGELWTKKWGLIQNPQSCNVVGYQVKVKTCTRNNYTYSPLIGKTGTVFDIASGKTGYVYFSNTFTEEGTYRFEFRFIDKSGAEVPQGNLSPLTATVTVNGLKKPNLTPYKPSGWSDAIVVSNVTGTTTHAGTIYSDQDIYVDWAVMNNGMAPVVIKFDTYLFVDNVLKAIWSTNPPLNVNYYVSVNDKNIGKLSAGTHTFKLVTDFNNTVSESNESDNQTTVTRSITTPVQSQPNLTPYTPSGWAGPLIISNVKGTYTHANTIYSTEDIYVDMAVANNGAAPANNTFYTKLYVENIEKRSWYKTPPLNPNYYWYAVDQNIGKLAAGTYTFKLVTDATSAISESNESDNMVSLSNKTISAYAQTKPNLTPFKPSGWTDPIVVSHVTGTTTDADVIYSDRDIYLDWAVINNGTSQTNARFYTSLYIDNIEKASWYKDPPLNTNYYIGLQDLNIGRLAAGTHTFKVVADKTNAISETNESDNEFSKSKGGGNPGTPSIRIEPTSITFNQSPADILQLDLPVPSVRMVEENGAAGVEEMNFTVGCNIRHLQIETKKEDGFDVIELQGDEYELYADQPGDPMLPARLVHVLVPPGAQISDLNVTVSRKRNLDGVFTIYPKQWDAPTIADDQFQENILSLRDDILNSPDPFPKSPVEFIDSAMIRGCSMFVFRVFPLQYEPKNKTVIVNEQFSWSFNAEPGIAGLGYGMRSPIIEEVMKQMAVNPNSLEQIVNLSIQEGAQALNDCDYLLITNNALKAAFQPLIDHKISKGVKAKLITTETIYSQYTGADSQEKIKKCIQDYAVNHGTIWVLLGGDDSVIPDRNCYGNVMTRDGLEVDATIPTDLYYAGLDDMNWNDDGDNYPCEISSSGDSVDLFPDVFLGRAPVQTSSDASAFVNKTIAYANTSPGSDYLKKVLLTGVKLWGIYEGKSDAHWTSDDLYNTYMKPYWNGTAYRLYDTGSDFGSATPQNLQNQISSGYGFLFMATHGNQTEWLMNNNSRFSSINALNCTNKDKQGIIYTMACTTNAFEIDNREYRSDPCLSEGFLRNPNGGAVGYIGSSRYGWGSGISKIDNGASMDFARNFFKQLFNAALLNPGYGGDPDPSKYPRQLGAVHSSHKISLTGYSDSYGPYRWLQFALNLMGDPHITVLTGESNAAQSSFTIYNSGDADLNITSMTKRDNKAWLDFTPKAPFTIAKGQSKNVTVTVDWTKMVSGTNQDQLIVYSNDSGKSPYPNAVYVSATPQIRRYAMNLSLEGNGKALINDKPYFEPLDLNLQADETITLKAVPDDRWAFKNWTIDGIEHPNPQVQVQMNAAKAVKAVFVQQNPSFTLTITKNGDGQVKVNDALCQSFPCVNRFEEGVSVKLEAASNNGFKYWSGSLAGSDNPAALVMDKDKSVEAVFEPPGVSGTWQAVILAKGELDGLAFDEWDAAGGNEQVLVNAYKAVIGVDTEAQTSEAPPDPPQYTVLLKVWNVFEDKWSDPYLKDIRKEGKAFYKWTIGVNPCGNAPPADASRSTVLSWKPAEFSNSGSYRLKDSKGAVVVSDMRTTTSYTIIGENAVQYFTIEYGDLPKIDMALNEGWNLISLPITPTDPSLSAIFPDAQVAYRFDETYEQVTSLYPGNGYWIKVPSARTYSISGTEFKSYSVKLEKGWHLLGAVSQSAEPQCDGSISAMFGFTDSYFPAEKLDKGKGYWIKVDSSCTFSLTSP